METSALMGLIGGLVSLGGGLIGQWLSGADSEEERRFREKALREYLSMQPPEVQARVAREVESNAFDDVRLDANREAELGRAQAAYEATAYGGGMDPAARADYEAASLASARQARGDTEAALASMAARGTLGSGEELAARLLNAQSGADRERMAGLQQAAQADSARQAALGNLSALAGSRQGRQLGLDTQRAAAANALATFNAGAYNDMSRFNAGLEQGNWDRRLALADRRAGGYGGMADFYGGRAGDTRRMWGGLGQSAGYGLGAAGNYMGQQQAQPQQPSPMATTMPVQQQAPTPYATTYQPPAQQAQQPQPMQAQGAPYDPRRRRTVR